MQINSKTLNIGIIGKGNFTDEMIRFFLDKKMFGLCCGLNSHKYENLLPLRNYEELEKVVDAVLIFDPEVPPILDIQGTLRGVFAHLSSSGPETEKIMQSWIQKVILER